MSIEVAVTGIADIQPRPNDSLELLIFRAARAALADAGLDRSDLDGVVIAGSDQVDGRAINSMLTSGSAGAYLNEEINVASSPAHALVLAHLKILSGTHRRLLVASWGKSSESASGTAPAERLSTEPFAERDGGMSALAAAAMQALMHRNSSLGAAGMHRAAAVLAARNHGLDDEGRTRIAVEDVTASPLVAFPLRRLEVPEETDGAFSLIIERADRADAAGVLLEGVGWCSDSARIGERDLLGLPHLRQASQEALSRAGATNSDISVWHLHDYTPDAEMLAYAALDLDDGVEAVLAAARGEGAGLASLPVNPEGGSLRGEAPFGGPLRKAIEAVRQLRDEAGQAQIPSASRAFVQITSGFAGQFQSAFVFGRNR